MRITMYCRVEMLDQIYQILRDFNTRLVNTDEIEPIFNQETLTSENAQRTHFQGWIEFSVSYDEYVHLQNYIA